MINLPLEMSMFLVLTTIVELTARGNAKNFSRFCGQPPPWPPCPPWPRWRSCSWRGRGCSPSISVRVPGRGVDLCHSGRGTARRRWSGNAGYVLIMTGHQNLMLRISLLSATVLFAGGFLVAGRFGPTGLAAVAAAAVAVQSLGQWLGRTLGLRGVDARRRRVRATDFDSKRGQKNLGHWDYCRAKTPVRVDRLHHRPSRSTVRGSSIRSTGRPAVPAP